jgi:hypothetical protein
VNVRKYEQVRREERIADEKTNAAVDCQLDRVWALAQDQYLKQDILGDATVTQKTKTMREQEEFDMARSLYGEELLQELLEPKSRLTRSRHTINSCGLSRQRSERSIAGRSPLSMNN